MTLWIVAAISFITGYVCAKVLPITLEIKEFKVPDRFVPRRSHIAPWIIMSAYVLMTLTSIVAFARADEASDNVREAVQCQSSYNREYYEAARARTAALEENDQVRADYDAAMLDFLSTAAVQISADTQTQSIIDDTREAAARYRQASDELVRSTKRLERARASTPYPEYPTNYCDPSPE